MGYETIFEGEFKLDRPLTEEQYEYLSNFMESRHVVFDREKIDRVDHSYFKFLDLPEKLGLGLGNDLCFVVDGPFPDGHFVLDSNESPASVPCLWCPWEIRSDRQTIAWNGDLNATDCVEWIQFLVHRILVPWGYQISGKVTWSGEYDDDKGYIEIKKGKIRVYEVKLTYVLAFEEKVGG